MLMNAVHPIQLIWVSKFEIWTSCRSMHLASTVHMMQIQMTWNIRWGLRTTRLRRSCYPSEITMPRCSTTCIKQQREWLQSFFITKISLNSKYSQNDWSISLILLLMPGLYEPYNDIIRFITRLFVRPIKFRCRHSRVTRQLRQIVQHLRAPPF